jgi:hypothetical protein
MTRREAGLIGIQGKKEALGTAEFKIKPRMNTDRHELEFPCASALGGLPTLPTQRVPVRPWVGPASALRVHSRPFAVKFLPSASIRGWISPIRVRPRSGFVRV